MKKHIKPSIYLVLITCLSAVFGCKKLVQIPPPISSITTSQTFSTDREATEAMAGIYNSMINAGETATNGDATIYCGASADELQFFTVGDPSHDQFQENALFPNNDHTAQFWVSMYSLIYGCNAVLDGVTHSTSIHDSVKNELTGEAKFVRAFSYFYLTNWFGDVPLVKTIDYNKTSLLTKSPTDTIYSAIIADLKDAEVRLAADYSAGLSQRVIPNRWAASALLARVYLYRGNWSGAVTEASKVINNVSLYQLAAHLNDVFLANSSEAIWQLQQSNQNYPYNATPEGSQIIPYPGNPPYVTIAPSLINAFEGSDQRKSTWVDSISYFGTTYYIPYKYRIGSAQAEVNGVDSAYYMVLRLGEQYLIRAEAQAQGSGGGISAAISDLNIIRSRAGLQPYAGAISPNSVLGAVYHERQVELFTEWGHRWLDLKRWGIAQQVLSANKNIQIKSTQLLYPIPPNEIQSDPNLKQNPGY